MKPRYAFQIGDPRVGPLPMLSGADAAAALLASMPHSSRRSVALALRVAIMERPHALPVLAPYPGPDAFVRAVRVD